MDRTERFYRIDRMLRSQQVVTFTALQHALEVSRATLKRDLEYMRSRLNAPIVWDREAGGYRLRQSASDAPRYEMPGLWFSPREIHALLTLQHLLVNVPAGSILAPHVAAVAERLQAALGGADHSAEELRRRVRIIGVATRELALEHFETVGSALLRRRRLRIRYFGRARGDVSDRELSPQRLVHYRDNWYLDAWCHLRESLRSFAVDAIRAAEILETLAQDVPDRELDAALDSGYGIFSGAQVAWARLRFTPRRARWVSTEQWHPRQRGRMQDDGSYLLELPYSDPRELMMDILRHGAEVEVLAPQSLRGALIAAIDAMRARYGDG